MSFWDRFKRSQKIESGDDSQIHQAGGDVTVHNYYRDPNSEGKNSRVLRPTGDDIVRYDPNIRKIIDAADRIPRMNRMGYRINAPMKVRRSPMSVLIFSIIILATLFLTNGSHVANLSKLILQMTCSVSEPLCRWASK